MLIWMRQHNGTRYEVRSAGNSLRLYSNGVFHSQYNPNHPVSGGVWDLLMLGAFFHDPAKIQRVLLLGVGGGTVIRQLNRFLQIDEIIGVDLDPIHLKVAREFFGADQPNVTLHCADARQWLRDYRGDKFDLVIDDLFCEQQGEPQRAVAMTRGWANKLLRPLADDGVLVANFVSEQQLKASALCSDPGCADNFASIFRLQISLYINGVGVFLKRPSSTGQLRQRLQGYPELAPGRRRSRLRYQIRTLKK